MAGYLIDKDKGKCYGCEACVQICPKSALKMEEDDEGFRYPILNKDLCVKCNLCHQVCLYENMPVRYVSSIALCFRKCKCLSFIFTFWIQFVQHVAL